MAAYCVLVPSRIRWLVKSKHRTKRAAQKAAAGKRNSMVRVCPPHAKRGHRLTVIV